MPRPDTDIIDYISHDEINLELYICTRILKLNSLHFGYWENGEALTMDNVRRAQARYTEKLLGHIPEDVRTVLDVGCGIGDVSKALLGRHYRVTALSPDREHARYFRQPDLAAVRFHNVKFEDLDLDETFDLVLMSESQNYFDTDVGFSQCRRYLRPGGYLLVCGLFKKSANGQVFEHLRNQEDRYMAAAEAHGFALRKHVDITRQVLPTMQYAQEAFDAHVLPLLEVVDRYARATSPLKRKVLRLIFRKEWRRASVIRKYYEEFFDPALLEEHVRYATHLYQYDGHAVPSSRPSAPSSP